MDSPESSKQDSHTSMVWRPTEWVGMPSLLSMRGISRGVGLSHLKQAFGTSNSALTPFSCILRMPFVRACRGPLPSEVCMKNRASSGLSTGMNVLHLQYCRAGWHTTICATSEWAPSEWPQLQIFLSRRPFLSAAEASSWSTSSAGPPNRANSSPVPSGSWVLFDSSIFSRGNNSFVIVEGFFCSCLCWTQAS